MKEFWGTLATHIKRGIVSPMFFICTALCTFLMMLFTIEYHDPSIHRNLGLYYFLDRFDNRGAKYLIMMITAFPSATMFYDDWTSGNFKFIIPRVGRRKYTFAVTISAGITAAAVMIISYLIFSAIVLAQFPAVPDMDAVKLRAHSFGFPNSGLLYTGHAFLCYLLYFLTKGAMAAFFAVFAVFQSMIFTNKHLTIISPVLIYIIYFSFNLFYITPTLLNPFVLFWNGYKLYLVFGGTEDGSLYSPIAGVYPMIFCVVIITILSLIESKILRLKMNKSI